MESFFFDGLNVRKCQGYMASTAKIPRGSIFYCYPLRNEISKAAGVTHWPRNLFCWEYSVWVWYC